MSRTPFEADLARLLDGLEPPLLSADFAGRVLAAAETQAVTPLPRLRRASARRRGIALGLAIAAVTGVAAAASVVPADVLRRLPVIGALVELVSPAAKPPLSSRVTRPTSATPQADALAVPAPAIMTPSAEASAQPARGSSPGVAAPGPFPAAQSPVRDAVRAESAPPDLREPPPALPAPEPRRIIELRSPIEPAPAGTGETTPALRSEAIPIEPAPTRAESGAPERTTLQPRLRERLPAAERVAPVERAAPAERVAPAETREILGQPRERQTVAPERGAREAPQPRATVERTTTRGN